MGIFFKCKLKIVFLISVYLIFISNQRVLLQLGSFFPRENKKHSQEHNQQIETKQLHNKQGFIKAVAWYVASPLDFKISKSLFGI